MVQLVIGQEHEIKIDTPSGYAYINYLVNLKKQKLFISVTR